MRKMFISVISLFLLFLIFQQVVLGGNVVKETSGITRLGDDLLIVGDEDNGVYYSFSLNGISGPEIQINPDKVKRVRAAG